MPQLFVPNLGTIIQLTENWTFKLFFEHRNHTLIQAHCDKKPDFSNITDAYDLKLKKKFFGWNEGDFAGHELLRHEEPMTEEQLSSTYRTYKSTNASRNAYLLATLPAGTQLVIDRIYIRRGVEAYNSVTFRTNKNCPEKKFRSKRFWARLADVNKIVADVIG